MTVQELEKFISQYGSSIYSFCQKLCRNKDLADELYQDVWLLAMQHIQEIQTDRNVKSYLLSLAVGSWRNKKKKYAVRHRIAPQEDITDQTLQGFADDSADTLNHILKKERRTAVLHAVDKLDDIYRLPILLYYMEELTIKEIAAAMHLTQGTVKRRLYTARHKLSGELEEYMHE